jgi:hypothetical protein
MPDDIREWYPSCPGASLRSGRLRAPGRVTQVARPAGSAYLTYLM